MSWWSPGEIRYSEVQVEWMLSHLLEMRQGEWPTDPNGSDPMVRSKLKPYAHFEPIACCVGELERRIDKCGAAGIALKLTLAYGEEHYRVAHAFGWNGRECHRRIRQAMRYVCGVRAKSVSYKEFVDKKSYLPKSTPEFRRENSA